MTDTQPHLKPKRRWLRFNLRVFVTFVFVLSIILGLLTWYLNLVARQKKAVAWVKSNGGTAYYEIQRDSLGDLGNGPPTIGVDYISSVVRVELGYSSSVSMDFRNPKSGENLNLVPLSSLRRLEHLVIRDFRIDGLEPLRSLHNLKELWLWNTEIFDLTPLSDLKNLEVLILMDMPVADLSPISNVVGLKEVHLEGTQVVDLSPLSDLPNLEKLSLTAPIKDFETLARLNRLKQLHIGGKFDEQLDSKIRRSLPKCKVTWFEYVRSSHAGQ